MIFGAVLIAALLLKGLVFSQKSSSDKPGPHNNWRKNTSTIRNSSWNESGEGFNGNSGGDGGGD
jgi:hypothetical protein